MNEELTLARLKEVLFYNPETGVFTWKVRPSKTSRRRVGDVAGGMKVTGKSGLQHLYVGIDGKDFLATRLAWFYMTGTWPKGRISYKNDDQSDLRFSNLLPQNTMNGTDKSWAKTGRNGWTEYNDARRAAFPEWERHRELRKNFGIGVPEYQKMLDAQGGVCAICSRPETSTRNGKLKWLAVDHNHTTGAIRGLLCSDCNTGIGKLKDSPDVLDAAATYLRKHAATEVDGFNVVPIGKRN